MFFLGLYMYYKVLPGNTWSGLVAVGGRLARLGWEGKSPPCTRICPAVVISSLGTFRVHAVQAEWSGAERSGAEWSG